MSPLGAPNTINVYAVQLIDLFSATLFLPKYTIELLHRPNQTIIVNLINILENRPIMLA